MSDPAEGRVHCPDSAERHKLTAAPLSFGMTPQTVDRLRHCGTNQICPSKAVGAVKQPHLATLGIELEDGDYHKRRTAQPCAARGPP
jgi:hypothetical protein